MGYPEGVQTSTLTFSNPITFLGNEATRTEVSVQATAGVVWAATGQPIDDFAELVAPGSGLPGSLTVPFVDQAGFTDQAGNAFTMWAYVVTRTTYFGNASKTVKKNWQPLVGQGTVDFDNLPGGSIGLPVAVPPNPVSSVAGLTGMVASGQLLSALEPELSATYGTLNPGGMIGVPVQGLYARTRPLPNQGFDIRPLAKDPTVPNRLWSVGAEFAQIGYTDDNGATFVAKTASPAGSSAGITQMLFSASYVWLLQGPNTPKAGSLWRSPLPDASGNGLVWTKMFDLAAPPNGLTTGDTATFRNSCVAVNGTNVYLVEYSTATITGGASLYHSADSGATWTKPKTWANAKHVHAVKVIGGVPWVMNGDGGFSDLGLWTATAANALVWNQRSSYGPLTGGNYYYGINFFPITVDGQAMVVTEYDGNENFGPMFFPTQDPTKTKPFFAPYRLPPTHLGTMRQLTLTSEGNLIWVNSSENGVLGSRDSIWISKAPFTSAVLLESFAPITDTLGDPVESGDYVWFGTYRVRKEKFAGQ